VENIIWLICSWTLSIVLSLSKNRPVFSSKHYVSETGFCLRPQVKPALLGPIDRASPYLRTPTPAPRSNTSYQTQHKLTARAKKMLILIFPLYTYEDLHQRTISMNSSLERSDTTYGINTRTQNFPPKLRFTRWIGGWVASKLWRREKSLATVGNRTLTAQPVARRYTHTEVAELTPSSSALLEKAAVAQLLNNFQTFIEPEGSLPSS
jgi:hypothetical protein